MRVGGPPFEGSGNHLGSGRTPGCLAEMADMWVTTVLVDCDPIVVSFYLRNVHKQELEWVKLRMFHKWGELYNVSVTPEHLSLSVIVMPPSPRSNPEVPPDPGAHCKNPTKPPHHTLGKSWPPESRRI